MKVVMERVSPLDIRIDFPYREVHFAQAPCGLVGLLIGNPIIFAGGTMVLGFAIGSALDKRSRSIES